MKPKKNQSGLGLIRKLGRGSIALGVAAFQQIPFGVGTVVSVGLHGLAMPSVIRWVQATDVPNRPVSVPVVELEGAELDQLPPSMRQELSTSRAGPSSGEEWDWFGARSGNRGNATVPKESLPQSSTPKTSTPRSGGRSQSSTSRSSSSVGGWRSPLDNYFRGNTSDNAQNRRLSRLLAQQQAEIERLREQQRRRSRDQDLDEGDGKDGEGDDTSDGGTDGQGGKVDGGDSKPGAGKGTDIPPELPDELRDRIAQLQGSSWEHDGRSVRNSGQVLGSAELNPWREVVAANQLKDTEGNKPEEVDDQFWLKHEVGENLEASLVVPFPSAILCSLSPTPGEVDIAMLGGPNGKFVPGESPKLLKSSGYGPLDGEALEWIYRNLRDTQLTPHQGYIIHLFTLSFPTTTCNSSGGDPAE